MTLNGGKWPSLSRTMLRALAPLALVMSGSMALAGWAYWSFGEAAAAHVAAAEESYQSAKDAKSKLEQERRIQMLAKAVRQKLEDVWNTLPVQQDFTSLALAVSELGRAEGVMIPGMNYTLKLAKEKAVPTEAVLTFNATGPYAGIYRFIHRLEHHSTYMVIDKLNVHGLSPSHKSGAHLVSFNVTLTTFLRPSPTGA